MNKTWVSELQQWIDDATDYEETAAQMVDDFCFVLQKQDGMTRQPNEDDIIDWSTDVAFIYEDAADRQIRAEIKRYEQIGKLYWPHEDFDIMQHLSQYIEL